MLYLSYHRLILAILLVALPRPQVWGCEYRPFPKLCKDYAPGAPGDHAIFIGRATRSFPNVATVDAYFDSVYGRSLPADPKALAARLKAFWRNHLTPDEAKRLDGPLPAPERSSPFGEEFGPTPVFTSFEVEEVFHGPFKKTAVEVIHGHADNGCLGVNFEAGKKYLVEVTRVNGRWYTGAQGETMALPGSIEPLFLQLLRRNVNDQLPQKFLFGSLYDNGFASPGATIRIVSSSGYEFETKTLERGQFLLTGLPDEDFDLFAEGRRIRRILGTLDLRRYSCSDILVISDSGGQQP